MRRAAFLALAVSLLFSTLACREKPAEPGRAEGVVLFRGKPVAMALVEAYVKPEQDRAVPPVAEIPSDEAGRFTLELPPGRHWLWAKATLVEGGREVRLVGQAVPNPVAPGPGERAAVTIELSDPSGFAQAAGPEGAGVRGRVTGGGESPATLYVYPGRVERPVGPGFAAAVEPDGAGDFTVHLAPGAYTLAARMRKSGRDFGPPDPGDRVGVRQVTVEAGAYADAGEIKLAPLDPERWKTTTAAPGRSATRVSGRVADQAGQPVAGVRVLAFRDGRMAGKPASVSAPTGPGGRYELSLPAGGTYYLGARSRLGGPSSPGEKVGQNRGPEGAGWKIAEGENKTGVDFVVEEVW